MSHIPASNSPETESSAADQPRPTRRASTRWAVPIFVGLAFGMAWLLALPLWLGDGLRSPWFTPLVLAMMITPAAAAVVVVLGLERPARPLSDLGLWPLPPVRRLLGYLALAVVLPAALILAALPVGVQLGVYPVDLIGLSGFRALLDAQLAPSGRSAAELPVSVHVLVLLQVLSVPLGAVLNLLPALGEELGWRGWLLPRLVPLGTLPAIGISGLLWGLWHTPVLLLGYNYPTAPGWLAVLAMVGMCTVVGAVFGWLRTQSGSVWPAAVAHASLNASAGLAFVFARAGTTVDTTQATLLGWTGWLVPVLVLGVLWATGRFRLRPVDSG